MIERTTSGRIATVAGTPIPIARLEERLDELRRGPRARHMPPDGAPGSSAMVRWVVQELVTEEVLRHEAVAAGIAPADAAGLMEHVTAAVTVPEAEVRGFYDRNLDRYRRPETRRFVHRVLIDEDEAQRVAKGLGTSGGPDAGDDLRDARRGELSGPFEDALFAASPGDVVGPVRTGQGWHVARLEAVDEASVVPFADARASIEAELLTAARLRAFGAWLDGRRHAVVEMEPEFEHPGHPSSGALGHRH